MNRIILAALLLVLVASVSAVEITEFDEGASVTIGTSDALNARYVNLTFNNNTCVVSARFTITSDMSPQINITRYGNDGVLLVDRGDSAFELNVTSSGPVVWLNSSGTSLCEGAECLPLVTEINRRLVSCNTDPGNPESCKIVLSPVNYTSSGSVTFSDLFIETKAGYTGPITYTNSDGNLVDGGTGFTCDNLFVCGNGQLDPGEDCDGGQDAITVATTQSTPSMAECDFLRSESFEIRSVYESNPNPSCPVGAAYEDYVTRRSAALAVTEFFARLYLDIRDENRFGLVDYNNNVPNGQKLAPTRVLDGPDGIIREIEQNTGLSESGICFSCAIMESYKLIEGSVSSPGTKKTILLMSDGAADSCYNLVQGNTDLDCSNYADGVDREEKAKNQAIELACNQLASAGVTIYTVAYGIGADQTTLRALSEGCTDGKHFEASDVASLLEAYEEIAFASAAECTDTCEYFNPETPVCGDNVQNFGEQCDFGTANTDDECNPEDQVSCTYCTTSCEIKVVEGPGPGSGICGDGTPDSPNSTGGIEQCDFGSENVDSSSHICPGSGPCTVCDENTCTLVSIEQPPAGFCGDGFKNTTEECDFGTANTDWCEPMPTDLNGDGVIDEGEEQCVTCTTQCILNVNGSSDPNNNPFCGDGTEQTYLVSGEPFTEQCDRGTGQNTDEPCNPAINGECSICTTSCELETYRGPFSPFSYCGDGSVQQPNDRGETEQCDWGTDANRDWCEPAPVDLDGDGVADMERCTVCTSACELFLNTTDPDDDNDPFCGDGVVETYPFGESTFVEQCDRGSDVNTDIPCSPDSGGTCSICTTSCQLEVYDNPFNDGCVDIIVGSNPGPYNLNAYVGSAVTFDLDLSWVVSYDSTSASSSSINPNIVSNNVLTINPDSAFTVGRLVLDVSDGSSTASLCLDFTAQSAAYGMTPEPDTRLLIREGRLVSGYYEEPLTGDIDTWGPYRISLEVWQR